MKVVNLDEFRNENIIVKLDGVDYEIPSKASVDITITFMQYHQALIDRDTDKLENIIKSIYNIFSKNKPDLDYDYFKSLLDSDTIIIIMNLMQGVDPERTKKILEEVVVDEKKSDQ